ncbi:MAG: ion transporter [Kofleriaceae bacterium]|nr:ion transporter [Kofleriaceae bacterium]MCL4224561.1 ion transporter [Myxococcales bacterium]
MSERLARLVAAPAFGHVITGVILVAAVLVGLETYPAIVARHGGLLAVLDALVLAIFVAEIAIRMGAHGRRPWRYFHDGWNVFDFLIVAVCFLPIDARYVTVLRLARLLRVLRLVRTLPRLQVLVGALIRSLPSMGYVALLLGLLFYVYAVAATFLFGGNDPVHFGRLETSLLSLFSVVTLEGWTDLMDIQRLGCAVAGYEGAEALCTASQARPLVAPLFFVSFILLGTMVMLNLFIGVIMSGMTEAAAERDAEERARARGGREATLAEELELLTREVADVHEQLDRVRRRAAQDAAAVARAQNQGPA